MPLSSLHEPFPIKLHGMLGDVDRHPELRSIISWNPDGKTFTVHQPKLFASTIMLRYFSHTKYKSFQRQMNLYHFTRVARGQRRNTYEHEYFIKDNAALCKYICRTKTRQTAAQIMDDPAPSGDTAALAVASSMPMTLDSIWNNQVQEAGNLPDLAASQAPIAAHASVASNSKVDSVPEPVSLNLSMDRFDILKADMESLIGPDSLPDNLGAPIQLAAAAESSKLGFEQDFWQLPSDSNPQQRPIELTGYVPPSQYPALEFKLVPVTTTMQAAGQNNNDNNNADNDDDVSIGTIDDFQGNFDPQDSSVIAV